VSLLSTNIKLLHTSFDLLTDTPSVTDRLLIMYGILLRQLFLFYSSCVQSITVFLCSWREHLFVSDLNMNILPDKYFKLFLVAKSYMTVSLNYFSSMAIF